MLQIQHIKKDYKTGDLIQHALNDVSVNLRDNEFVAILGPSGSGKTTLLNVIGGLDRYDSGDLIINGISTKKYKDRDWDSYRNHTIGFVFQSYNLIMHQTVLANVELALTISGISGSKRREKAKAALEKVGLKDHMYKKPGQMSGGQMQRVAIARALVNDPDIVLADEPTGALDSDTSVQVMDLLQEVAKDRLVVMVTHNPELAEQYATRIVTIKDGSILSDTDPYEPEAERVVPAVHKNLGRSSMSFLTALALSFNNLRTKKARTILVAFAGSIGIIGIALILSLSTGVNQYIQHQESETLSEYPLQLQKTGFDLTGLMTSGDSTTAMSSSSSAEEEVSGKVVVAEVMEEMFSGVSTNNLAALKTYLDSGESGIEEYVRSIEYRYQITPQIYLEQGEDILQVNPSNLFEGVSAADNSLSVMLQMSSSSSYFHELPQNEQLYRDSYVVSAGHWPENENELVLVLGSGGRVSDLVLYGIGMKDRAEIEGKFRDDAPAEEVRTVSVTESAYSEEELNDMTEGVYSVGERSVSTEDMLQTEEETAGTAETAEAEKDGILQLYDYEDFLGRTFKLVYNSDFYAYDEEYEVWTDKSGNDEYLRELVEEGKELVIAGVVQPKEDASVTMLSAGIGYTYELKTDVMEHAAESEVVQQQLADPELNVFTGRPFGESRDASDIDLSELFSFDEEAFADLFGGEDADLDMSALTGSLSGMDLSGLDLSGISLSGLDFSDMDFSDMDFSDMDLSQLDVSTLTGEDGQMDMETFSQLLPSFTAAQLSELIEAALKDMTQEQAGELLEQLAGEVLAGYAEYIGTNTAADISMLGSQVGKYLTTQAASDILQSWLSGVIESNKNLLFTEAELRELVTDSLKGFASSDWLRSVEFPDLNEINGIADALAYVQKYMGEFERYLADASTISSFREEMIRRIDGITVTETQRTSLFNTLLSGYDTWAKANEGPQIDEIASQFSAYLQTEGAGKILEKYAGSFIDTDALTAKLGEILSESMGSMSEALGTLISQAAAQILPQIMSSLTEQIAKQMSSSMQTFSAQLTSAISGSIGSMMGGLTSSIEQALSDSLTDMFTVDPEAFSEAVSFNMSAEEIGELLSSLLTSGSTTLSDNLSAMGYADPADPYEIDLYPNDFEAKNQVAAILDAYNQQCIAEGHEDRTITYTDYVAAMMSSVTRIIDAISYVLIAFVAISLVVSSIMIGVITYISVLERRKEIGVLRAIGASKNNVSQVFNAETFITGLLAGSIGIGVTIALTFPINALIKRIVEQEGLRAQLPLGSAGVLIVLSVVLTMIAGLLPAGKAARSDPVSALRSE